MLGCFAKAKSYEIMVDTTEVRSIAAHAHIAGGKCGTGSPLPSLYRPLTSNNYTLPSPPCPVQMEDVQWYDRSELLAAVQLYDQHPEETMQSECCDAPREHCCHVCHTVCRMRS